MFPRNLDRDPVEELAEEFLDRCRNGEHPGIEEYTQRHPELAEAIAELFPTIAAMEGFKLKQDRIVDSHQVTGLGSLKELGDYQILREIGRGGMGIVYLAEQKSLGRTVALKILQGQLTGNLTQLARFDREARTAAQLHHTNIVPVFGVGHDQGFHFYVMQAIPGIGLDRILRKLCSQSHDRPPQTTDITELVQQLLQDASGQTIWELTSGKVFGKEAVKSPTSLLGSPEDNASPETSVEEEPATPPPLPKDYWKFVGQVGVQVSSALSYAHGQGVLHRDIKPGNLLLDDRLAVWVTDFGLAKGAESGTSQSGDIAGTLRYMAPERLHGESDERSDVYSLGVTLYEMATLRPAFTDADPTQMLHQILHGKPLPPRKANPALPRDLETIILKSIEREPARRYASARELQQDLQRFLEDRPVLARRASLPEQLARWCRRNPALSAVSGLALLLLMLVAIISTVAWVKTTGALKQEQTQREKAEETLQLSLELLDRIGMRFAPDDTQSMPQMQISLEEGTSISLPVRAAVSPETAAILEELLAFYDRFAELDTENQPLRRQAARAMRRIGDLRQRLGQWDRALEAYQAALARFETFSPDEESRREIARIQTELGNVAQQSNQPEQAEKYYSSALALLTQSVEETASPQQRYELARTSYFLGRRQLDNSQAEPANPPPPPGPPGRRPPFPPEHPPHPGPPPWEEHPQEEQRKVHLNRAIDILTKLREENSTNPEYRQLLALCYQERATEFDSEDAEQAVAILEALCREFPTVPDFRFALCQSHELIDVPRLSPRDRTRWEQAEEHVRQALGHAETLILAFPEVPRYRIATIHIHHKLAGLLWEGPGGSAASEEQLNEARQHAEAAVNQMANSLQNAEASVDEQIWLARLRHTLGRILMEQGEWVTALDLTMTSWDELREVAKSVPEESRDIMGRTLEETSMMLARILDHIEEYDAADRVQQEWLDLREEFPPPPRRDLPPPPPHHGPPRRP